MIVNIIFTLVGALIGGAISWFISRHYYLKQLDEQRKRDDSNYQAAIVERQHAEREKERNRLYQVRMKRYDEYRVDRDRPWSVEVDARGTASTVRIKNETGHDQKDVVVGLGRLDSHFPEEEIFRFPNIATGAWFSFKAPNDLHEVEGFIVNWRTSAYPGTGSFVLPVNPHYSMWEYRKAGK